MKPLRRTALPVLILALFISAAAQAQPLMHLPPNPWVVIKVNNVQGTNDKAAALIKRFAIAEMAQMAGLDFPADPLVAVKEQMGIEAGIDFKGDAVVALYAPLADGRAPRVLALIPVSDYKAFLGNFGPDVQQDGNISELSQMPPIFSTHWGKYAALTNTREFVVQPHAGIQVPGLVGKQLDGKDIVIYANVKALSEKVLPQLRQNRAAILAEVERSARNAAPDQFLPLGRAILSQGLNFAELLLTDTQAATWGITLSNQGFNVTAVAEFTPGSKLGDAMKAIKNTDAPLTAGLPDGKYFVYGGGVLDSAQAGKIVSDALEPIIKELAAMGGDMKPVLRMLEAYKGMVSASEGGAVGMLAPAGADEGLVRAIAVARGDAARLAAAQAEYMQASAEVMQMGPDGQRVTLEVRPKAKTIDGVTLDTFKMKFEGAPNTPEAKFMSILYGPDGMSGYMGVLDDKTYIQVTGDEALLVAALAAARKQESPLEQAKTTQAVAAQLPKSRAMVYYIAVDQMVNAGLKVAKDEGFDMNIELPAGISPVGVSIGSEGTALRIDYYIPVDLIETLISAGMQIKAATERRMDEGMP